MVSEIKKNSYKIKSSTIWILLLTSAIVTLYFNSRAQDPFNTPKLIILVLSSAWLLGHLLVSYKNEKELILIDLNHSINI